MQVIAHEGSGELAEILTQSKVLQTIDHHQLRLQVIECNGQDVLLFVDSNNNAITVYPCAAFDSEFGGSIHDQARQSLRDVA